MFVSDLIKRLQALPGDFYVWKLDDTRELLPVDEIIVWDDTKEIVL
jgi:hypothetical protein